MDFLYTLIAALVGVFLGYRYFCAHRIQPRRFTAQWPDEPNGGRLYRAGETVIATRAATGEGARTVVAFPGFLEDMRYFQSLYADFEGQLILVNNADYHNPFDGEVTALDDWPANPHKLGTIEYDGFQLAQVVSRLAEGTAVVVHGHSRGGAVTLEAARQFPAVMKPADRSIRAILEAAVLPGAKVAGPFGKPIGFMIARVFFPIVMTALRKSPVEQLLKQPMMRPTNELKTALCQSIYFTPIRYATAVTNSVSIRDWQRDHEPGLFSGYERIDVVVGERDNVLDKRSMIASAEAGREQNSGVAILHTTQTNHFVTLEQPDSMRALSR